MATIYAMPNAQEWERRDNEKWDAYFARTEKLMDDLHKKASALPKGEYVGALIRFPVADGYAVYYVHKLKPLTICHVPFGDKWRAHALIEKGLNVAEVKKMVDRERKLAEIFSRKK